MKFFNVLIFNQLIQIQYRNILMGNQCNHCCLETQNNIKQFTQSQMPEKLAFQQSQWPQQDVYIFNQLNKLHKTVEKPFKHKTKNIYYMGEWQNNIPHGQGIIYIPNSLYYQGTFSDGKPQKTGYANFLNSDCSYTGNFHDGQAAGEGTYKNNKQKYWFKGLWYNSTPIQGTIYFDNDQTTIKVIDFSKKIAKIIYNHNKYYEGQIDGVKFIPQGIGMAIIDDGQYNGEWHNGKMHGKGVFIWKNGEKYDGEYVAGKKQGRGYFIFKSGKSFDGQWKNGHMHGNGIMWNKNQQQIHRGKWSEGKFVENSLYEEKHKQLFRQFEQQRK